MITQTARGFFLWSDFLRNVNLKGASISDIKRPSCNAFKPNGGVKMRDKITLACTECNQRNYDKKKNKKNDPDRLEMKKYCKFCKKHTVHKETK